VVEFKKTDEFSDWLKKLKDRRSKANILERIKRTEESDFGDCKWNVSNDVSEMRIHFAHTGGGSGGDLQGYWSRHITEKERILYEVVG